jgi:hypothetical protein
MIEKPSENEEVYFTRLELERRRKAAEERQAALQVEEREKARALHHMKCPKCGMQLEDINYADVRVDKCFGCARAQLISKKVVWKLCHRCPQ